MGYPRKAHHGKPAMTRDQSKLHMTMFLAQCRDEMLEKTTAADLTVRYKVKIGEAEAALSKAKAVRNVRSI